jgi:hypothetical protein
MHKGVSTGKINERDHLENLEIRGRLILKLISTQQDERLGTGFICHRTGASGRLSRTRYTEPYVGSTQGGEFDRLRNYKLTKEQICSMMGQTLQRPWQRTTNRLPHPKSSRQYDTLEGCSSTNALRSVLDWWVLGLCATLWSHSNLLNETLWQQRVKMGTLRWMMIYWQL